MTTATGIGASIKRKEDLRFLTGNGNYVSDIKRPNMAAGVFLLRARFTYPGDVATAAASNQGGSSAPQGGSSPPSGDSSPPEGGSSPAKSRRTNESVCRRNADLANRHQRIGKVRAFIILAGLTRPQQNRAVAPNCMTNRTELLFVQI